MTVFGKCRVPCPRMRVTVSVSPCLCNVELVNLLTDQEKQLKVVSIVGFGGLGKTTLANVVYGRLKGEFMHCAFIPVSQKPDIRKLLCSLLSQLGSRASSHDFELNVLLDQLREYLQNKRYLVIMDDIWDVQAWGVFKCAFPENDLGSRVIITTRIQDVAKACCPHLHDHILKMKPLSDEDSKRLFLDRIFGSEEACPQELRDVSVEILKKCGGLPLAVISISSLLASEGSKQKERWEGVRNSLGSGTSLTLNGVRQILNLSYKDLPCHLKTCLLYLGMYPEDYTIQRFNLELQWMAEGFVSRENGQAVEKVARNYFNELVNRSLIQPVSFDKKGSVTECRVHDMMLDLILLKSAEENFFTIVNDPQAITALDYKARRLSIRLDGASDDGTVLPRNISLSQVRSVMFFGGSQKTPPLSQFKRLRVLFIDMYDATVDLTRLCKLYQLRYLWIRGRCSYKLPTQISMLQHLETLSLPNCDNVPSDIVHLPCLMHLNVNTRLPDGIGNMKSLQHLHEFDLEDTLDNIKGLGELTNLRDLFISCGHHPRDWERRMDTLCSSLGRLCNLKELHLYLAGCMDGLMPLSPLYRLEILIMWMGGLQNLGELKFQVDELPNNGVGILADLPALTHLGLKILKPTNEMIVIYGKGAFPALKRFRLQLSNASYLTFQAGAMPKLQRLKLKFNACRSERNGAGPAGIEHLSALEEFSAAIGCGGAMEYETSTGYALRSAINMHPSHPRIAIEFLRYNFSFY